MSTALIIAHAQSTPSHAPKSTVRCLCRLVSSTLRMEEECVEGCSSRAVSTSRVDPWRDEACSRMAGSFSTGRCLVLTGASWVGPPGVGGGVGERVAYALPLCVTNNGEVVGW